jgi:lysozyme
MGEKPLIIDLSHWNPTPNWERLVEGGIVGVIHKATEGETFRDEEMFWRSVDAKAVGLAWSTYHFLRPGGIEGQMEHYLTTIDPVEGERVCLDHEDAGVSLNDLKNAVSYLIDMRPDLKITIYSGHVIKEQLGSGFDRYLCDNTDLWIAHYYVETPVWPSSTWPQWSLWQYTDCAAIDGCSAPVDGDRYNGNAEAARAWLAPSGVAVIA